MIGNKRHDLLLTLCERAHTLQMEVGGTTNLCEVACAWWGALQTTIIGYGGMIGSSSDVCKSLFNNVAYAAPPPTKKARPVGPASLRFGVPM